MPEIIFYRMVDRLGLEKNHPVKNMSCGQRSQLVLGLLSISLEDAFIGYTGRY